MMMKSWMNAGLTILLSGIAVSLPSSADEPPAKQSETTQESDNAPETSDETDPSQTKVESEIDITVDKDSVDRIIKSVTESLDLSTLSDDVKSSIVDGVRKGLESASGTSVRIEGPSITRESMKKGAFPFNLGAIVLPDGVFIDGAAGSYRIELKDNGAITLDQSKLADGIEGIRKRIRDGQLKRKRYAIGIALATVDAESSDSPSPLKIESVFKDSPAEEAGMKAGDLLVSIDDKPLESPEDMINRIQEAGSAGKAVTVAWLRDGETISAEIQPFDQPFTSPVDARIQVLRALGSNGANRVEAKVTLDNQADANAYESESESISELKSEVSSLRDEIKELKELIQANR